MNLILITPSGRPVLLTDLPEKPQFSALELLSPAVDTDTPIRQYKEALQSAIKDESKWIPFKDENYVKVMVIGFQSFTTGQTFSIPSGWSVKIGYQRKSLFRGKEEGHSWDDISEVEYSAVVGSDFEKFSRKVALLIQEPTSTVASAIKKEFEWMTPEVSDRFTKEAKFVASPSQEDKQSSDDAYEEMLATCGDCGEKLTLVRPGKHQCDNPDCIQNKRSQDLTLKKHG